MSIIFILLGVALVLAGILTITKKWMWIQQGMFNRPVHVEKYMRYEGSVDIIFGLIGITLGIIGFEININDIISFVYILVYIPLKICGEVKYHKK